MSGLIVKRKAAKETKPLPNTVINTDSLERRCALDRISKDIDEVKQLRQEGFDVDIQPDNDDKFIVYIKYRPPEQSIWHKGVFNFKVMFPESYPFVPYRVIYTGPNRIWHPNIEIDANKSEWGVCLEERLYWTPAFTLRQFVVGGLIALFLFPNANEPLPGLCKVAADQWKSDYKAFVEKAQRYIQGDYH